MSKKRMYAFEPFAVQIHEPKSRERPKGRSGHRIACDEKFMYSFGGYNPGIEENDPELQADETWRATKSLLRELWKYNYFTRRWKKLPTHKDMPKEVASNAVILKGRLLFIYGGTGVPFGSCSSNNLYACDLQSGATKLLPSRGWLPEALYGQAMVTHEQYLYTLGGTTGLDYTCDIHRYDLKNLQWEAVYVCSGQVWEPQGRYRHELAFDGNVIYVLGGGTQLDAFDFQDIPAFNLLIKKWLLLEAREDPVYSLPAPRKCHGLVQYMDEKTGNISVVISGGSTSTHEFRDVWRLDLKNLQWTCLAKCVLPSPLYFHSVALTPQGKMYTFGGVKKTSSGLVRMDTVFSTWLIVPKLQEMCWEALNYYVKDLSSIPCKHLRSLGVPLQFLTRLEND